MGRKYKEEWEQKRMGWKNKDRRKALQEKMTTGKEYKKKNEGRKDYKKEWQQEKKERITKMTIEKEDYNNEW